MKIVAISDTHMGHAEMDLPAGDVLLHAGDATFMGKDAEIIEVNRWFQWLKNVKKFREIIFVPGNHDFLFEDSPGLARELMPAATVLIDEPHTFEGIKFYGSPWVPAFGDWAFMRPHGAPLKHIWDLIPKDTDVLITHGPPYGFFDRNLGDLDLGRRIMEINPRFHLFGHIHRLNQEALRHAYIMQTSYANVAMMDEEYQVLDDPFEFEITPPASKPSA